MYVRKEKGIISPTDKLIPNCSKGVVPGIMPKPDRQFSEIVRA